MSQPNPSETTDQDQEILQRIDSFGNLLENVNPQKLIPVFLNTLNASYLHLFLLGLKPAAYVERVDEETFYKIHELFPNTRACTIKEYQPQTGIPADKDFGLLYDPVAVNSRIVQYNDILSKIGLDMRKFENIPYFMNNFFKDIDRDPFLEGLIIGYPIEDCMRYYLWHSAPQEGESKPDYELREKVFGKYLQAKQGNNWHEIERATRKLECFENAVASWVGYGPSEEFDNLTAKLSKIKIQTNYLEIVENAKQRYEEWVSTL